MASTLELGAAEAHCWGSLYRAAVEWPPARLRGLKVGFYLLFVRGPTRLTFLWYSLSNRTKFFSWLRIYLFVQINLLKKTADLWSEKGGLALTDGGPLVLSRVEIFVAFSPRRALMALLLERGQPGAVPGAVSSCLELRLHRLASAPLFPRDVQERPLLRFLPRAAGRVSQGYAL